jgi:hypothetical protein
MLRRDGLLHLHIQGRVHRALHQRIRQADAMPQQFEGDRLDMLRTDVQRPQRQPGSR